MSSSDVRYACGCYSYADDCRSQGSAGFCKKHKDLKLDNYERWKRIRRDNKGKNNWGAA